jgi:hypothetical protein
MAVQDKGGLNVNAAGYIAFDSKGFIHGTGETADAAWVDALKTFGQGASGLTTIPATRDLLSLVNTRGGAVQWRRSMHDIACCPSEVEDEESEEEEDE